MPLSNAAKTFVDCVTDSLRTLLPMNCSGFVIGQTVLLLAGTGAGLAPARNRLPSDTCSPDDSWPGGIVRRAE